MRLISTSQDAVEAFAFCEAWLECLARRDFGAACDLIVPDGHYPWTPELIERLITNYGHTEPLRSGRRCTVTSPVLAAGIPSLSSLRVAEDDDICTGQVHSRFPFAVYWFLDGPSQKGALGWLHLDYPLDGKWSDLSSIFDIVPRSGQYAFDLERIEVM
jgi:hypothetical protein